MESSPPKTQTQHIEEQELVEHPRESVHSQKTQSVKPRTTSKAIELEPPKSKYSHQSYSHKSHQSHQLEFLLDKTQIQVPHTGTTYQNLPKLILVATLISLSSFYFGYELTILSSVPSSTLAQLYTDQVNNSTLKSFLTGGIPLGAIFGSLLANRLMVVLSRRKYLVIVGIFVLVTNIIIQINNVWLLLVCRLLSGVYVGLYLAIVPIYIHQLCPHCVSGSFGAFTQLAHILGVTVCYMVGMIFYVTGDTSEFVVRFQLQITSVLIIIQMICLLIDYVPESPNSLIQKHDIDQARQVLIMFHGQDHIEQLIKQKQLQNEDLDEDQTVSINESLAVDKISLTWKSALLGFTLPFMQQISGVNFLVTQAGVITGEFHPQVQPYTGFTVNFIQFLATAFSVYLLSKVGRKPLLQFGNLTLGLINVILGILFFYINIWRVAFPLVLVFICLFMICFGFTLGPVVWLYIPEILPTKMVPLAVVMNWVGCSFCVIVCPIITSYTDNNPWLIFLILGGIQFLLFIPNILFLVETKGLTSYQINAKMK